MSIQPFSLLHKKVVRGLSVDYLSSLNIQFSILEPCACEIDTLIKLVRTVYVVDR